MTISDRHRKMRCTTNRAEAAAPPPPELGQQKHTVISSCRHLIYEAILSYDPDMKFIFITHFHCTIQHIMESWLEGS